MVKVDARPFDGMHCETTATGTLLGQMGINLSEPMLFGLGEGLGYAFFNMKVMDFPFIGGRVKPDLLTQNLVRNLGLRIEVKETASRKKAWANVVEDLSAGRAVGLKLDCFYLEYFSKAPHFAAHYVAMTGYDDDWAYLVDTRSQGGAVKTSLASLADARAAKGPMASKALSYTLHQDADLPDLADAIRAAVARNATEFLNPPIKNFGYKGIAKTAGELLKWYKSSEDIAGEFSLSASLMEGGGTGGALFRNLWRDFLAEAAQATGEDRFAIASDRYADCALDWTSIAACLAETGKTESEQPLHEAATLLRALSEKERVAMAGLLEGV